MNIASSIKVTGPLFQAASKALVEAGTRKTEDEAAEYALNELQDRMQATFRNPTGAFEAKVRTGRRSTNAIVTDGGVVYGPWLEGTSSRNKTSRFKGYANFRKASQTVQAKIPRVAGPVVDRYITRKLD